jgi:hypothetical protein
VNIDTDEDVEEVSSWDVLQVEHAYKGLAGRVKLARELASGRHRPQNILEENKASTLVALVIFSF